MKRRRKVAASLSSPLPYPTNKVSAHHSASDVPAYEEPA
ncbi:protein of unknown function [Paraburkholderia kururiensis]